MIFRKILGCAFWLFVFIAGAISLFIIIVANVLPEKPASQSTSSSKSTQSLPDLQEAYNQKKRENMLLLNLRPVQWSKGGFGNVFLADFTIDNKGDFDAQDISIVCYTYGSSGTRIDMNKSTLYQKLKRKSTLKVRNFNVGFIDKQAATAACEITNFDYDLEAMAKAAGKR